MTSHHSLSGKVSLIIGASRGIGATTAKALAAAGSQVVLASRDEGALAVLADAINSAGGESLAVQTDARVPADLERAVSRAVEVFGRLDVAFNNAGSGHRPAPLADLRIEDIDEAISVNLRGTLVAMKYELAAMLRTGGGSIVNVSSTAGLQGVRGMAAYTATKHAVIGATRAAALDYAAQGVRVNVVAPGPILTDALRNLPSERRAMVERAVPLGRVGLVDEVANAVLWLASDASSFVTGAVLPIDGGRTAGA